MEVSLSADDVSKCRCCMGPSVSAKDLSREYDWMGEKEVYADMLLESFDIKLLRQMAAGWTICDSCITRLRDSSNFKKQVLYSEKCLLQKLNSGQGTAKDEGGEGKPDVSLMKHESTESDDEDRNDLFETHFYEDDNEEEEFKHVSVKLEPVASTSTELSNDEDIPLSSLTAGVKRKAPAKTAKSAVAAKQPKLTVNTIKQNIRQRYEQLVKNTTTARKIPIKTAPSKFLPIKSMPAKKTALLKISGQKMSGQKILGQRPPVQKILGQRPSGQKILGQRPLGQKAEQGDTAQAALLKLSGRPLKITLKNPTTAAVKKGQTCQDANKKPNTSGSILAHQDDSAIRIKDLMAKENAMMLLQCSNIVPFKWSLTLGFRCFYCEKPYRDVTELRTHTNTHPTNNLKQVIKKLKKESFIKIDVTSMQCILCSENFTDVEDLKIHLINNHKKCFYNGVGLSVLPFRLVKERFDCVMCGKRCTTLHTLNHHIKTHFNKYICEKCGQGFASANCLRLHNMTHESSFKCTLCEKSFSSQSTLKTHRQNEHNMKNFICVKCSDTFTTAITLRKHCIIVHNEKELAFKCDSCEWTFNVEQHLTRHRRRVHLKERPISCDLCDRTFFLKK